MAREKKVKPGRVRFPHKVGVWNVPASYFKPKIKKVTPSDYGAK